MGENEFANWAFPGLSEKKEEKPAEQPENELSDEEEKVLADDADWMKTLPGYQDEAAIHKKLEEDHARRLAAGEVDKFGNEIKKPEEKPAE